MMQVPAPDNIDADSEQTYFINNWSEPLAKLATEEMEMKVLPRFQKAGHQLTFTTDWSLIDSGCEASQGSIDQTPKKNKLSFLRSVADLLARPLQHLVLTVFLQETKP